jgi:membrane protein required for colicin V production
MNWVDIAIVAIVLISAIISLFRGFVREILSLVVWVAALWAAASFARAGAALLEPYTSIETVRLVAGFVGVLVLALLAGGIVNYVLGRLLEKTGLSGPDRLLGVIFGMLRGVAIVAAIVFVAGLTARRAGLARGAPDAAVRDARARGCRHAAGGRRPPFQLLTSSRCAPSRNRQDHPRCAESSASSPRARSTRCCTTV